MSDARPLLLVSGIADGLGASLANSFAASGYDILGLSRSDRATTRVSRLVADEGGVYVHRRCDITKPMQVATALSADVDRVAVFVHNAHALVLETSRETTLGDFALAWRVTCFSAMVVAKFVLPAMIARGHGTIIFTGATASRRGGANASAFASAKFALRGLAQALARECGPKGIHVAHVVIDGLIDEPQTLKRFGPAAKANRIDPASIAQTYLHIARQPSSAWTHELDLRPYSERF